MKILIAAIIGAVCIALLVVYLNRRQPNPVIPKSVSAKQGLVKRGTAKAAQRAQQLPFNIEGDIRNRQLAKFVLPEYPEWAEEKGVMGTIKVQVAVNPEGQIKSNIKLLQTTGSPDLDEVALQAIRLWRFSALPGATGNQEGIITIRFQLGIKKVE